MEKETNKEEETEETTTYVTEEKTIETMTKKEVEEEIEEEWSMNENIRKTNIREVFKELTSVYFTKSVMSGDADGFRAFYTALAVFRADTCEEYRYHY